MTHQVFQEVKADKSISWRETIGSLSFGAKVDSGALQIADLLAYICYRTECEKIENNHGSEAVYITDFEVDLIYACGITILKHLIEPRDMSALRQNYLRKRKRPVFERAQVDMSHFEIDPTSYEARYAGLRAP